MDDWLAPADAEPHGRRAGAAAARRAPPSPAAVEELAGLLAEARAPALVVGAGADDARRRGPRSSRSPSGSACPVWQESFGARAGFPQDHPLFAGHLPAGRARLREALAGHDVVLAVGAPVFRQYPYEPGPLVRARHAVALVTDDPDEAHRSPAELARARRARPRSAPRWRASVPARDAEPAPGRSRGPRRPTRRPPASRCGPATCSPRSPSGCRADAVARRGDARRAGPSCTRASPRARPLGFLSAAMGGLGFGLPARDRRADGAARPAGGGRGRRRLVALRDPGALERRALRRGRAVRRARQRRLRGHGPARRAQGAARRRGRRSSTSTSRALARALGCDARRVDDARRAAGGARRGRCRPWPGGRSRCCSRSWSSRTRTSTPEPSHEYQAD